MKIAINSLPLKSAHKTRGIGYYTKYLIESLKEDSSLEIQQFESLSEVNDADLVHYPWFDLYFHTLPIKKRFPTVVTIHDVIPLVFPKHYPVGIRGKANFILQKLALNSCKYIITDSQVSKEDITKYLKIESKKIAAIHLAADPKFEVLADSTKLLHIKRQYRLPDRFLLYVGDANWVKNLPFFIDNFRQIIHDPGFEDVRLVLVGGVFLKNVENIIHPELESLKLVNQLIKQHKMDDFIIRPGQIDNTTLVTFYNLATAYIQPSFYEGFGLPVLQAFACGTPVVASNKGSLPEIGGQAAVYFDPANSKQFISVTKEILTSRSLQGKLSRLGLEQAAKFSWKKAAWEVKSVYLKAVKKYE